MEGSPGRGILGGEAYPKLLDLIAGGSEWMERERLGGGGGRNDLGAAEEQKLELRLGPPGGDDWRVGREEKKEELPVRSLGFLPRPPKCSVHTSAGAKRGFMDTLGNEIKGFEHHQPQKPSFLRFASAPAMVNATSQNANGTNITEQQQKQQSLERKAGPPASAASPVSKSAVASRDSSQARAAPAPAPAPVVGWPPIRSFRKNLASSTSKPPSQPETGNPEKSEKQKICSKGMFVKINMDGIPIGRKVDLKAYDSYEKLCSAVDELFRALLAAQREAPHLGAQDRQGPGQAITGLLDDSGEYTLVYEDTEGDVLLVGDVPWNMFVSAVKRLRVLKSSELPALSVSSYLLLSQKAHGFPNWQRATGNAAQQKLRLTDRSLLAVLHWTLITRRGQTGLLLPGPPFVCLLKKRSS
ncbi:hypothetical protein Taro_032154 [Colocasia esculenta]|uniref:Auxin-responsive protein n=1 Tax=Colocasia esculenta TaxID=4460 RepID=A0A843VU13_COLES|nr:hypothetical protein [Colocasia esculenta]